MVLFPNSRLTGGAAKGPRRAPGARAEKVAPVMSVGVVVAQVEDHRTEGVAGAEIPGGIVAADRDLLLAEGPADGPAVQRRAGAVDFEVGPAVAGAEEVVGPGDGRPDRAAADGHAAAGLQLDRVDVHAGGRVHVAVADHGQVQLDLADLGRPAGPDRKSTRLNSSHKQT